MDIWRNSCSRRVRGWQLVAQMPTELVLTALEQSLTRRDASPRWVSSATPTVAARTPARPTRQRIAEAGALASYARLGNPSNNVQAEAP